MSSVEVLSRKKVHKVNFDDALNVLNIAGFHYFKQKTFNLKRICLTVNISISILSGLMELILHFNGMSTVKRAAQALIPESEVALKLFLVSLYKKEIIFLMNDCEEFWELSAFGDEYSNQFLKAHILLEKCAKFFKYTVQLGSFGYVLVHAFFHREIPLVLSYNETKGIESPFFEIYFLIHISCVFLGTYAVVGFDTVFFYLIGHIFSELKMLEAALVDKTIFMLKRRDKLKILIQHHMFVLEFIKNFNKIASGMLMIQNMICMFAICLFLFIMSETIKTEPYMLMELIPSMCIYLLQLFLYSIAGQILTETSAAISNAFFYECAQLQEFEKDFSQNLLFCIQRSQLEAKLTTGPFGVANFQSFTNSLKTAFSFLAFLNTINKK